MFAVTPAQDDWWMPARGQELSTSENRDLYRMIYGWGPNAPATFNLPTIPAPAPGVEYYIATMGPAPFTD
jgi:Phage Tail Collar Domain